MTKKNAVVLLSGGLDSATVLAMARAQGYECFALSVDYGQRHHSELEAAERVAKMLGAKEHRVVHINLTGFGGSALTDNNIAVPQQPGEGIPTTYVPARNTIMLSLALAWAEVLKSQDIFIGVNAVDYSGYPDCRPAFYRAFEHAAGAGTRAGAAGGKIKFLTPLIRLSKAGIIRLAVKLKAPLSLTWSCYAGGSRPCGHCDSCKLRAKGFRDAGLNDPALGSDGRPGKVKANRT